MAVPLVQLGADQANALVVLAMRGPERLSRLRAKLENLGTRSIKLDRMRQVFYTELPDIPKSQADRSVRLLISLATIMRKNFSSADEVLEGVLVGSSGTGWEPEQRTLVENCLPIFAALLNVPVVVVTAKAVDLAFDYSYFFLDARILADVRPVFDPERDNVVGVNISQTLRLVYASSDGDQHDISIAMDLRDIERLQEACEQTIKKAKVVANLVEKRLGLDTMDLREVGDGRG